jgi:hypothetical protein
MPAQAQQHGHAVGQGEGGDVGEEVGIALGQVEEGAIELLVEGQAVAAAVGGDDGDACVERHAQLVGIARRLVLANE